jgi:hypothetical protein
MRHGLRQQFEVMKVKVPRNGAMMLGLILAAHALILLFLMTSHGARRAAALADNAPSGTGVMMVLRLPRMQRLPVSSLPLPMLPMSRENPAPASPLPMLPKPREENSAPASPLPLWPKPRENPAPATFASRLDVPARAAGRTPDE